VAELGQLCLRVVHLSVKVDLHLFGGWVDAVVLAQVWLRFFLGRHAWCEHRVVRFYGYPAGSVFLETLTVARDDAFNHTDHFLFDAFDELYCGKLVVVIQVVEDTIGRLPVQSLGLTTSVQPIIYRSSRFEHFDFAFLKFYEDYLHEQCLETFSADKLDVPKLMYSIRGEVGLLFSCD